MSKLTDLTEVTTLADGDLAMAVDVSNTSMDATGTNSKVTLANIYAYIKTKTDLLYAAVLGADDNYVTDAEKIVIGNTSGTNSGDNAVNSNYSGLVTNATHTGDATGDTALTVVAINGTNLAALGTGVLKNTTTTGVPFISKVALTEPATSATLTIADGQTLTVDGSATITNGTHSGTNTGDNTVATALTGTPSITVATVTTTGNIELGHASDTTIARESAGIYSVEGEIMNGFTSTATSAGTITMDKSYSKVQQFTGTSTHTIKLPTTGIIKGQQYIIQNIGTSTACKVTVQSSGANEILILGYGCTGIFTSTQATPTTAAHWTFQKLGLNSLTATSYTTDTGTSLNCDYWDDFIVTAQAGAIKLNNPTGTARDGQLLFVAITGTAARAVTYDTQFEASTVALPSTTVTTARLNMVFKWRADTSKWVILATS